MKSPVTMPADMFAAAKAAQVARLFANLEGGTISKLKLMKLLYLVERLSIANRLRPMFFDTYFSMKDGPVCSAALDKLAPSETWEHLLTSVSNEEIESTGNDPEYDELSRADKKIIAEVWSEVGHMSASELRQYTHDNCGEYDEIQSGRKAIMLERIASALVSAETDDQSK